MEQRSLAFFFRAMAGAGDGAASGLQMRHLSRVGIVPYNETEFFGQHFTPTYVCIHQYC